MYFSFKFRNPKIVYTIIFTIYCIFLFTSRVKYEYYNRRDFQDYIRPDEKRCISFL